MTSKEQCGDDRFEIINETKQYIINATNIETSPEEMAVLDSICFRLWQLGLTKRKKDKLDKLNDKATPKKIIPQWRKGYDPKLYYPKSFHCPSCGRRLRIDQFYKWCPDCNQALEKWSDEDDK